MDTFFGLNFHFFLELALETWANTSLTHSLWVHDPNYTHSFVSFQWSGLSNQQTLRLTESCLQIWKWYPYRGRGVVSIPICANKVRNGPASTDQGHSIASQGSHDVHGMSWICLPTSSYPTFLLAQNRLCQLITCIQSQTMTKGIIGRKRVNGRELPDEKGRKKVVT